MDLKWFLESVPIENCSKFWLTSYPVVQIPLFYDPPKVAGETNESVSVEVFTKILWTPITWNCGYLADHAESRLVDRSLNYLIVMHEVKVLFNVRREQKP